MVRELREEQNMKRAILITACVLLAPALALATGFTANLSGDGGSGVAVITITGNTISYNILVSGLSSPDAAELSDGSTTIDLAPTFSGGSAIGSVSNAAASDVEADPGSWTVTVGNGSASVSGQLLGTSGEDAGTLAFEMDSYEAQEGAGAVGVKVSRTGNTVGQVSVSYRTVDGSAVAGVDYTATSGTMTWANGSGGAKTITVPILANSVPDAARDFTVELFGPGGGAVLGSPDSTEVSIADDDSPTDPCVADGTTACLSDDRFQVVIDWAAADGRSGQAGKVDLTDDGAWFWFFNQSNPEMFVKVLDACTPSLGNRYWVFAAGLTDVEVTITVTDTETGLVRTYESAQGNAFDALQDTSAFASCP